MRTISLNVSEEEEKLIEDYVNDNCLNLSEFINEAIFEKTEEDLPLDERRILQQEKKQNLKEDMIIQRFGRGWEYKFVG